MTRAVGLSTKLRLVIGGLAVFALASGCRRVPPHHGALSATLEAALRGFPSPACVTGIAGKRLCRSDRDRRAVAFIMDSTRQLLRVAEQWTFDSQAARDAAYARLRDSVAGVLGPARVCAQGNDYSVSDVLEWEVDSVRVLVGKDEFKAVEKSWTILPSCPAAADSVMLRPA